MKMYVRQEPYPMKWLPPPAFEYFPNEEGIFQPNKFAVYPEPRSTGVIAKALSELGEYNSSWQRIFQALPKLTGDQQISALFREFSKSYTFENSGYHVIAAFLLLHLHFNKTFAGTPLSQIETFFSSKSKPAVAASFQDHFFAQSEFYPFTNKSKTAFFPKFLEALEQGHPLFIHCGNDNLSPFDYLFMFPSPTPKEWNILVGDSKRHTTRSVETDYVNKVLIAILSFCNAMHGVGHHVKKVVPFILCLTKIAVPRHPKVDLAGEWDSAQDAGAGAATARSHLMTRLNQFGCVDVVTLSPETFELLPWTPFLFMMHPSVR